MFQVRIHGRGGQGVVTAAEMLSVAAFVDGRHAQAFPSFGSERMGAPVTAFARLDELPIRSHDPVTAPDAVVVQDPTLFADTSLLDGLAALGLLLVNTVRPPGDLPVSLAPGRRLVTVPATEIARRTVGRPVPNTALLGALAALTGVVTVGGLEAAVRRRFPPPLADANVRALREAAALSAGADA
ncbi:2-oxoacid:acceptor oxidoreductase [Acidimicrobiaceae bacterium USS-CC1]|uniref:2-oxoacid:acceptor oxidoreductase n=1 Tax=Acidiferrimicrobium australe TaxID=2664430 RepID=A0ABW9QTE6_9ACTN|nr:2-oxoacid:acceptor oxidoreductase [Acidiferrimicrobium australe]